MTNTHPPISESVPQVERGTASSVVGNAENTTRPVTQSLNQSSAPSTNSNAENTTRPVTQPLNQPSALSTNSNAENTTRPVTQPLNQPSALSTNSNADQILKRRQSRSKRSLLRIPNALGGFSPTCGPSAVRNVPPTDADCVVE